MFNSYVAETISMELHRLAEIKRAGSGGSIIDAIDTTMANLERLLRMIIGDRGTEQMLSGLNNAEKYPVGEDIDAGKFYEKEIQDENFNEPGMRILAGNNDPCGCGGESIS